MKLNNVNLHIQEGTIEEFLLDEYRLFLKVQWLTHETILFYIKLIHRFINYSKISDIKDFQNYLKIKVAYNKLFDRELKNSSLDKFRKSLVKYYTFLLENELVEQNYAKRLIKVKQPKKLPDSLSQEHIDIIIEHILKDYKIDFFRYRAYMMFCTFLNTWIRRNELIHIKKENITQQYIKIENWKGRKDRLVYISKNFSKQLQDYISLQLKNPEYLFCNSAWKQLDNDSVNRVFRQLQKKTWINVYPHLLRHTYASTCVRQWVNIYTLQQQLWHTDLKTTSIYLYLNWTENWEEVQKVSF